MTAYANGHLWVKKMVLIKPLLCSAFRFPWNKHFWHSKQFSASIFIHLQPVAKSSSLQFIKLALNDPLKYSLSKQFFPSKSGPVCQGRAGEHSWKKTRMAWVTGGAMHWEWSRTVSELFLVILYSKWTSSDAAKRGFFFPWLPFLFCLITVGCCIMIVSVGGKKNLQNSIWHEPEVWY